MRCSPYILFEIRSAERADLPRFILFDPRTGFRPPPNAGPHAVYLAGKLDEISSRLEHQSEDVTLAELDRWLVWLEENLRPRVEGGQFTCAFLLEKGPEFNAFRVLAREAISKAGFGEPLELSDGFHNDAELLQVLRGLRLLVVDISSSSLLPLYHLAHALIVPSVRLQCRDRQRRMTFCRGCFAAIPQAIKKIC